MECTYHGWKFDAHTGQCKVIPSITADSTLPVRTHLHRAAFPCEERDGYAWVYFANSEEGVRRTCERATEPRSPPRNSLSQKFSERFRIAHLSADLACSMDHGIVGLMDPAHGPFVHQSWWWRSRRSIRDKEKTFEPIPQSVSG